MQVTVSYGGAPQQGGYNQGFQQQQRGFAGAGSQQVGYPNQVFQQQGGYPNQGFQQQGGYPNQGFQQQGGYPNQGLQQQVGYPPQGYQQQPGGFPNQGFQQQQGGYPNQQQFSQYPPQVKTPGQQAPVPKKGWGRLERDGIFIQQQFNLGAALTGCVANNIFKIYPLGKDGDKRGKALMKAREESGFCSRQCLAGDCRPFVMKVQLDDDDEHFDKLNFLEIDRECKCTFLCCNRPEIKVTCVEDGNSAYLGKVVNPWTPCNVQLDIYDSIGVLKYIIDANCCQLGFHINLPCEACQTVEFEIKSPSGQTISTLTKRAPNCLAAFADLELENFVVNFPPGCIKEDKALIMAAVLFADYRFFERKPKGAGGGGF